MDQEPQVLTWENTTLAPFWAYQAQFPECISFRKGAVLHQFLRSILPAAGEVLDNGCGPSHFIPHLLAAGYRVTGADFDESTMAKAVDVGGHEGFRGYRTVQSLMEEKPPRFDAVVLLEVVEHLDDRWLAVTLNKVRSLLRSGGALVVTTPNNERLEESFVYLPVSKVIFHRWQQVSSWSAMSLSHTLASYGFENVRALTRTFPQPRPPHISLIRHRISRLLSREVATAT